MESKLFRNSVSVVVVITMIMSVFALPVLLDDGVNAAEKEKSASASYTINQSAKLRNGIKAIMSDGVATTKSPSVAYVASPTRNKITMASASRMKNDRKFFKVGRMTSDGFTANIKNYILSQGASLTSTVGIEVGASFYVPGVTTITTPKYNSKDYGKLKYNNSDIKLDANTLDISLRINSAGRHKLVQEFEKYTIDYVATDPTSGQIVGFTISPNYQTQTITKYFQIKRQLKFVGGKVKKSKRSKFVTVGKKFGKLPSAGKKYTGWYKTKKSKTKYTKKTKMKKGVGALKVYAKKK
jgi:hypothetical protein